VSLVPLLLVLALCGSPGAGADLDAGRRKAEVCAACHGADGNATLPGMPSLAGMPAFYTHWQLIMFRDGRRRDPQMSPLAAALSDDDMADLAAFYAAQPPRPRAAPVDPGLARAGAPLARRYHCTSCHGLTLMGQGQVPRLAGQDLDYLRRRLHGFRERTASDLDGTMTVAAQALSAEDVERLAHYLAGLGPAGHRVAPATPDGTPP
jgi:cytochrome c553